MRSIFSLIMFLSCVFSFGQDAPVVVDKKPVDEVQYEQIFTTVQVQAQPPGGMNAFRQYIGTSFKIPDVNQTTMANVVARFVVGDDGAIRDIQILKETPANLGLGKEAIRVISASEKWTPGIYNGRTVTQYYTLPIRIEITPATKK